MLLPSKLPLSEQSLSLEHDAFIDVLANTENLLIIQDLDGVCMRLVKDPLSRVIELAYVEATQVFDGQFFVLTNGEHMGKRGVNGIIERAVGDPVWAKQKGLYLPGLAAGGVQWQDKQGAVFHPGVSDQELVFLAQVPNKVEDRLRRFFEQIPDLLTVEELETCIQSAILDNKASPTVNLNTFHERLSDRADIFADLQQDMQALMDDLLLEAAQNGLGESFFVHYAPNLGRDASGKEIIWLTQGEASGTTDFQFMLRGAVKEAGVLAILNHYVFRRTGEYPLGEGFNARQAPNNHADLLNLVEDAFKPEQLPTMVGVGDTVTSKVEEIAAGQTQARRGGSDRNFLQLIQDIGQRFSNGNLVVYVDSSDGELKNRKPLKVGPLPASDSAESASKTPKVLEGPGDPLDINDPLKLNVAFPEGYRQYTSIFQEAARRRLRE